MCTCTARLTYLESRHTKEEGKCLSASEHHRITPSYTDSTSELPLLSFVFSSIFFLSQSFLLTLKGYTFRPLLARRLFQSKCCQTCVMCLPPPIFFKKKDGFSGFNSIDMRVMSRVYYKKWYLIFHLTSIENSKHFK